MNRSILSLSVMMLFLACRCALAGGPSYFEYPVSVPAVTTTELSVYENPPTEGYLFYARATKEIGKLPSGTFVRILGVTTLETLRGLQIWARIRLQTDTSVSGWVFVTDESAKTITLRTPDGSNLKLPR